MFNDTEEDIIIIKDYLEEKHAKNKYYKDMLLEEIMFEEKEEDKTKDLIIFTFEGKTI